jgi:DNA-binding CsgD family transcriptional regulator
MHEIRDQRARARVLSACVEITLASGDRSSARAAAEELERLAGAIDAPFLRALSAHASGAVRLADNEVTIALDCLRDASAAWQDLDAPYELARVRTLIGLAYRHLKDHDGAQLEFDAAQEIFDRLGAAPDAARVAALSAPPSSSLAAAGGLTGREVEVLRLVATGATNREIANRLAISEKTVARHLSNIFTKLDLPSRSAATAYAYEHRLV